MALRLTLFADSSWRRRLTSAVILSLGAVLLLLGLTARADASLIYRVKAAFIFNFSKFVEWPTEQNSRPPESLQFCVYGDDGFLPVLEQTLQGKKVQGKDLKVRRVGRTADMEGCLVVFMADDNSRQLADLLSELRDQPVLTVGDHPRFLDMGGMIRFLIVDNKVRFEISQQTAEEAGLTMSSKLLQIAHNVQRGDKNGPGRPR